MEWISFEERKPECNQRVIFLFDNGRIGDTESHFYCPNSEGPQITHWMPRPPDPVKKRWEPKEEEKYFCVSTRGNILESIYTTHIDKEICVFTGCYKTSLEAETMRDKIKEFVTKEIGEV